MVRVGCGPCWRLLDSLRLRMDFLWARVRDRRSLARIAAVTSGEGGSPKMKNLMKAAINRTMESWPRINPWVKESLRHASAPESACSVFRQRWGGQLTSVPTWLDKHLAPYYPFRPLSVINCILCPTKGPVWFVLDVGITCGDQGICRIHLPCLFSRFHPRAWRALGPSPVRWASLSYRGLLTSAGAVGRKDPPQHLQRTPARATSPGMLATDSGVPSVTGMDAFLSTSHPARYSSSTQQLKRG